MIAEAQRRADDAANGCARKQPVGDPRALILARLPGTRQELRAATGLSLADTKAAIHALLRTGVIQTINGRFVRR